MEQRLVSKPNTLAISTLCDDVLFWFVFLACTDFRERCQNTLVSVKHPISTHTVSYFSCVYNLNTTGRRRSLIQEVNSFLLRVDWETRD